MTMSLMYCAELQKVQKASQQFVQQQHENEMVLKELEMAGEDAKIYKLMGPVLVPQDHIEATSNVKKRLEFIQKEEKRLAEKMKSLQEKSMAIEGKIMELQHHASRQSSQ